jgi:hypothetical protein
MEQPPGFVAQSEYRGVSRQCLQIKKDTIWSQAITKSLVWKVLQGSHESLLPEN